MFVLVEMKDTVRIPPWLFNIKFNDAVNEALNKKFANKVVHNVGLCIALWDITKIEDSFIFPGDGASHSIVHFRYIVYRPFIDEVLTGKTKSCSKEGVYVSMGFFDDILIPADAMQHPSRFDDKEQLWAWSYEVEEEKHDLFMDIGEEISEPAAFCAELIDNYPTFPCRKCLRFRVVDETFVDTTPTGPDGTSVETSDNPDSESKKSPYTIVGSISEPGLGLLSWWNS